jgi:NADH-ubiquinone oxidoreductase chain 5
MEGPTPVSALIHAATMVTAGVFLIARCSLLFEYAPTALGVVTVMGAMTAFFAATTALVQNDLKRVIAYSTCSQLGYMVFACGTSNYNVGIFHLANHAFFKALLFLTAGAIIHALADEQDMRKMGGLVKVLPYSYSLIMIGSLSLAGFPFLTGFYSKDAILEMAYGTFSITGHFAHWFGTAAAFLTAFYSIRLIYLTFLNKTNAFRTSIENSHDMPKIMGYPLLPLIFGSIFVGYLLKDMIIGAGTLFWQNALFVLPENLSIFDAEFLPHFIKIIPVLFSSSGILLAILFYGIFPLTTIYNFKMSLFGQKFYLFFNKKWFFDKIYNEYINQFVLKLGYIISYKTIDRGLIENLGPHGLSKLFYNKRFNLLHYQTGLLYHYTFMMLIGSILLITITGLFSFSLSFPVLIIFSLLLLLSNFYK